MHPGASKQWARITSRCDCFDEAGGGASPQSAAPWDASQQGCGSGGLEDSVAVVAQPPGNDSCSRLWPSRRFFRWILSSRCLLNAWRHEVESPGRFAKRLQPPTKRYRYHAIPCSISGALDHSLARGDLAWSASLCLRAYVSVPTCSHNARRSHVASKGLPQV